MASLSQLFDKCFLEVDERTQNKIFYLSLFDPTSWEEGFDLKSNKLDRIKEDIMVILESNKFSNFSKKFKKISHNEKDLFLKQFFYSGHATNHILCGYTRQLGVVILPEGRSGDFDLKIFGEGNCKSCVGIKRFLSSLNIFDDITQHYQKVVSCGYLNNLCKHLVICYIPLMEHESPSRIHRLLQAYQYQFREMKPNEIRGDVSIIIIPVTVDGNSEKESALKETHDRIKGFIF